MRKETVSSTNKKGYMKTGNVTPATVWYQNPSGSLSLLRLNSTARIKAGFKHQRKDGQDYAKVESWKLLSNRIFSCPKSKSDVDGELLCNVCITMSIL